MTKGLSRGVAIWLMQASMTGALLTQAHSPAAPPPPGAKSQVCSGRAVPQLVDITEKTGIRFRHLSAPRKEIHRRVHERRCPCYRLRSRWLAGPLFHECPYGRDDAEGREGSERFYHNNHDGTFSDVTDKAGVASPCFAMGGAVGDYNNDGRPDIYVTCLGGNVLYRNNGNGTFTDVAKQAGVTDGRWSTGAAFGDYDGDGFVDLWSPTTSTSS